MDILREHIEIVQGAGGPKARIAGSRVRVQDVVIWYEKLGMSADEIVHEYWSLTLADVYAALTYYWGHREEIEARIAADDALAEEIRRERRGLLEERLRLLHER